MVVLLSCAVFPSAHIQLIAIPDHDSYFHVTFMKKLIGLEEISLNRITAFETYIGHVCQRLVFPEHIFNE